MKYIIKEEKDLENYSYKLHQPIVKGSLYEPESVTNKNVSKLFSAMCALLNDTDTYQTLAASALVYKDSYLMKINEESGMGLHECEFINLLNQIRLNKAEVAVPTGLPFYLSNNGVKNCGLYKEESDLLEQATMPVRFMFSNEELIILVMSGNTTSGNLTNKLLTQIAMCCEKAHEAGMFNNISFYISTPNVKLEISEWDETSLVETISGLSNLIHINDVKRLRKVSK